MQASIPAALVILTFAYFTLSYIWMRQRQWKLKKELGCKPLPAFPMIDIFGIREAIGLMNARKKNKMLEFMAERFDVVSQREGRHVSTFTFEMLGKTMYMTKDPKIMQAVLATQFKNFEFGHARRDSFHGLVGDSILSTDGKSWEHHRSVLRPHFNREHIGDLNLFERHIQTMMKALPTEGNWTAVKDLQPLFHHFAMDVAAEYFMGHSTGCQEAAIQGSNGLDAPRYPKDAEFVHAIEQSLSCITEAIFLGDWYSFGLTKEFHRLCKVCHDYVDEIIQKTVKHPKSLASSPRRPLLEELLDQNLNPAEVRSQSLTMLLAGRDTTAALLSFVFLSFAQHPNVYNKVRTIVLAEFGTYHDPKELSFAKLKSCYYLQWCLNETLRLYPVFPLNVRQSVKDVSLPTGGGSDGQSPIFVPKDTLFWMDTHAMHRDRKLWGPDADAFRPDRWEGRKMGFEYLPWSAGPRICIGQQLALTEAAYVTARMVQRFDKIDNSGLGGLPVELFMTTNILPLHGVKVRLRQDP